MTCFLGRRGWSGWERPSQIRKLQGGGGSNFDYDPAKESSDKTKEPEEEDRLKLSDLKGVQFWTSESSSDEDSANYTRSPPCNQFSELESKLSFHNLDKHKEIGTVLQNKDSRNNEPQDHIRKLQGCGGRNFDYDPAKESSDKTKEPEEEDRLKLSDLKGVQFWTSESSSDEDSADYTRSPPCNQFSELESKLSFHNLDKHKEIGTVLQNKDSRYNEPQDDVINVVNFVMHNILHAICCEKEQEIKRIRDNERNCRPVPHNRLFISHRYEPFPKRYVLNDETADHPKNQ
ncbi:uncharacterized protein LOC129231651 [Uloborus diversus]|uniref:uncharacterized protein LOC129231651 n=1 Tax=Uloborus diversus TaxID=327109 RepID=UPI002409EF1C|nr:uncharacterized protein LOC129231651 [Uloborus diversus]